jgi:hypothetical protein
VNGYDVALFVHLLGAVTLFAAFGILQGGGVRVRRAATVDHVRLWITLLRAAVPLFPLAFAALVIAGLYMTVDVWGFSTPWVLVALGTVAVMIGVGTGIVGRGMNRMGTTVADAHDGPIPSDLSTVVADPRIWLSLFGLNGAAIGILWLMATKPGWVESVGVPLAFAGAGIVIGRVILTRERRVA